MKTFLPACLVLAFLTASATAQTTVFDHDFASGTPGELGVDGNLGTPTVGTLTATGGFISSGNQTYASGNNGPSNSIPVASTLVDRLD